MQGSVIRCCRRPHFRTVISPNQLANFSQILSLATLGGGKAALGFGPDRIKTGYHSSRKLTLTYNVPAFSQSPLIGSLSNLQVSQTGRRYQMSSNLGLIGLFTMELFTLEHSH